MVDTAESGPGSPSDLSDTFYGIEVQSLLSKSPRGEL